MNLLPSPVSPALPSRGGHNNADVFMRSELTERCYGPGDQCSVGWVTMEHCVASVMLISPRCRLVRVSCLLTPLPLHRGEKNGAYTYFDILYSEIVEFDVK